MSNDEALFYSSSTTPFTTVLIPCILNVCNEKRFSPDSLVSKVSKSVVLSIGSVH